MNNREREFDTYRHIDDLYFNSSTSTNSSINQPSFYLDRRVESPNHFLLKSVYVPNSYYVFDNLHNGFVVRENSTNIITINITPGNYDSSGICSEISTKLNASTLNAYTYSCSISGITGKLTLSVSSGSIELLPSNASFTSKIYLGIVSNSSSPASSQTGEYPVRLSGDSFLNFHSIELKGNILSNISMDGSSVSSIISRIPVSSSPFSYIFYEPEQNTPYQFRNDLSSVSFYFTRLDGSLVDFNNVPFQCHFVLLSKSL